MEKKKQKKKFSGGFAECNYHSTRQRIFFLKKERQGLPSAREAALGKRKFKKIKKALPSALPLALGKENRKKQQDLCRVPCLWHSAQKIEN
jgi:hypothetical protein